MPSRFAFPILLLACLLASTVAPAADRPNVLLICVDDLKPILGCYGDTLVKSPNIDRLAKRSTLFERAHCNQAVCSPSRNALLVGLRPQTLGIYDLATNFRRARPDAVTLPQHFKQHGWRTEAMGKVFHVGHGNTNDERSWSVPHWNSKTAVQYALPESKGKREGDDAHRAPVESADVPDSAYADGAVADEAIRRLQAAKQKPNEPFFLAVGLIRPHLPFVAPKKYWDLYDRAAFKLAEVRTPPEGAPSYAPQFGGELRQYSDIPKKGDLDDELQRTLIHGYHASISYMDAQLGRVIDELDRLELAKNTIIVLWGDHGWHLGDHGIWCKHTNYEQAARIPLLIAAPGVSGGSRSSALVETVDVYPTLCELAGLAPVDGLEGKSLAKVLRDPKTNHRDHVIHVYPRGQHLGRAIRTDRYRLVEWKTIGESTSTAEFELYDYQSDPLERKNLAADQPNVVEELRAILATHPEAKPQIPAEGKAGEPAKPAAKTDRNALFAKKDKDQDGKLTREEFLANQPDPEEAPKRFTRFDGNGDGVLSREEFVGMGKK